MKIMIPIAAAAMLAASPTLAHEPMHKPGMKPMTDMRPMAGMKPMSGMMIKDPGNPYHAAEMEMHMKMMAAKAGDASEMWTRKMIEHHRGAIAMSRVALTAAIDAPTRRMAQMTIDMQAKDVAELQGMLRTMGKTAQ